MAYLQLPRCSFNSQESIDGSVKNADSVRPNTLIMAQRCFDPGVESKRSSIPVCQSRAYGQGLPPVTLNF